MKYKRKPTVVEAIQWNVTPTETEVGVVYESGPQKGEPVLEQDEDTGEFHQETRTLTEFPSNLNEVVAFGGVWPETNRPKIVRNVVGTRVTCQDKNQRPFDVEPGEWIVKDDDNLYKLSKLAFETEYESAEEGA